MPTRRTRQARLDADETDLGLLDEYANYHVLRKPYLSATAVASFHTCNLRPFVARVASALGLDSETPEMRAGSAAHQAVQGALVSAAPPTELSLGEALDLGRFAFEVERPLQDPRRRLRGVADIVFARGGRPHVLELKHARPPRAPDPDWAAPVWPEHGLQVQFYGLLARREFGRAPRLALAYMRGAPKARVLDALTRSRDPEQALLGLWAESVPLDPSPPARQLVDRDIRAFRRAERLPLLPAPNHRDPSRCARCFVRAWCPRRLDQPGDFEALDPALLSPTP